MANSRRLQRVGSRGMVRRMRLNWALVFLLALAIPFLGARPGNARWESERDNRSRAELEQFDDRKLFEEAFDVCVRRAALLTGSRATPGTERSIAAADDYLAVIEAVARAKFGAIPSWLRELSFARTTKECQAVFRAFVSGETAPETRPAQATAPDSAPASKAAPSPTNGARSSQVPPTKRTPTRTPVIRVPAFPVVWHTPTPLRSAPSVRRETPVAPSRTHVKPPAPAPKPAEKSTPLRATPVRTPTPSGEEITDEFPPWFR